MKLNVTVDLSDVWSDGEMEIQDVISDEIKNAVYKEVAARCSADQVKAMAEKIGTSAISEIERIMQSRAESFMGEEIAIHGRWGKPEFVGSIEDLMKQKFDDAVLSPVDGSGKKLNGCTSSAKTWIQWRIEKELGDTLKRHIRDAETAISREIKKEIKEQLESYKADRMKSEVAVALGAILNR